MNDASLLGCTGFFAAFFDLKIGCVLEWSTCKNSKLLDNIESLVLGTGFQKSDNEVVIFRHSFDSESWGCASFNLLHTDLSTDRYSRMRAVGIMAKNIIAARSIAPILSWVASEANKDSIKSDIIQELTDILMRTETICADIWIWFRRLSTSNMLTTSPNDTTTRSLALQHSFFLVLLRAILARRRVLLFSRNRATQLCDIYLDLIRCLGLTDYPSSSSTEHKGDRSRPIPVGFMTAPFAFTLQETARLTEGGGKAVSLTDPHSSWIVTTTDIAVASTLAAWEVLFVLHVGEDKDSGCSIICEGKEISSTHSCFHTVISPDKYIRQKLTLVIRKGESHSSAWCPVDSRQDSRQLNCMNGLQGVAAWREELELRLLEYSLGSKNEDIAAEDIALACDIPKKYISWLYTLCRQRGVQCSAPRPLGSRFPPTMLARLCCRSYSQVRGVQRKTNRAVIPIAR